MWWRLGAGRLVREHRRTIQHGLDRLSGPDPRRLPDFEVWTVLEQCSGGVAAAADLLARLDLAHAERPSVHRYGAWRNEVHSGMMRLLDALSLWHQALAERFVERGWIERRAHYFLLEQDELAAVVNGRRGSDTLRRIVEARLHERKPTLAAMAGPGKPGPYGALE